MKEGYKFSCVQLSQEWISENFFFQFFKIGQYSFFLISFFMRFSI